jgi:hypothetical protein
MRFKLEGQIVEVDEFPWEQGNKTGVAYSVYVKADDAPGRLAPTRCAVSAVQYGGFKVGDDVALPVDVILDAFEGRRPRIKVTLDKEFRTSGLKAAAHATG